MPHKNTSIIYLWRCFYLATKGQKQTKYDFDFKLRVISEYEEGASQSYLASKYSIPSGTLATWMHTKKYRGIKEYKRGRPHGSPVDNYKERYEILKKYQDFLVNKEQRKK